LSGRCELIAEQFPYLGWFPYDGCVRYDRKKVVFHMIATIAERFSPAIEAITWKPAFNDRQTSLI